MAVWFSTVLYSNAWSSSRGPRQQAPMYITGFADPQQPWQPGSLFNLYVDGLQQDRPSHSTAPTVQYDVTVWLLCGAVFFTELSQLRLFFSCGRCQAGRWPNSVPQQARHAHLVPTLAVTSWVRDCRFEGSRHILGVLLLVRRQHAQISAEAGMARAMGPKLHGGLARRQRRLHSTL